MNQECFNHCQSLSMETSITWRGTNQWHNFDKTLTGNLQKILYFDFCAFDESIRILYNQNPFSGLTTKFFQFR